MKGTCLQFPIAEDLTNTGDKFSHSNKGTQAGKPHLDEVVTTLANLAPEENEIYSLVNLFSSMNSLHKIPPLAHDVLKKEPTLNPRAAPFPIFLPKDHLSLKSMDQNEIVMKKTSKAIKTRGKKTGKKRNQRLSKKKAKKVKFEEREQVESTNELEQVPLVKNFQNRTEGATIVVLLRDHGQTDLPVTPSAISDSINVILPDTAPLGAMDICPRLITQKAGEQF
ncbi:hypothetical protein NDU88_001921 [Pleurodeles waltl]|uniref:Uncharacterized protein n=1 Tax=Pleurodeles waltl TaxID=8319 RepID=A0AAV7UW36_PLEWA|nr:hypothetical protein NDU88_001921 [Pleurodeles waltl]